MVNTNSKDKDFIDILKNAKSYNKKMKEKNPINMDEINKKITGTKVDFKNEKGTYEANTLNSIERLKNLRNKVGLKRTDPNKYIDSNPKSSISKKIAVIKQKNKK